MTPSDLGRVFGGRVLRIVDEQICVLEEIGMPQILPRDLPLTGRQNARIGLVVTRVDDCDAVRLQAIAERERGMIEVLGRHSDVTDIEGAFDQVVIANGGVEPIERDGKIGVLHLPGERLAQGLVEALGTVDVPFGAGTE